MLLAVFNPFNYAATRFTRFISYSLVKFCVFLASILFLSTVMSVLVSFLIRVPAEMEQNLNFKVDSNNLVAKAYSKCPNNPDLNADLSCISIEAKKYSVSADINLKRAINSTNLIEVEIEFVSFVNPKNNFSIKKVAFIKEENSIIDRIFNFFSAPRIHIKFIDELDNSNFHLEKVSLKINSDQIEVDSSKIYFVPQLSYIQYFIGKTYYITLVLVFYGAVISQLLLVFAILIYGWISKWLTKSKKE